MTEIRKVCFSKDAFVIKVTVESNRKESACWTERERPRKNFNFHIIIQLLLKMFMRKLENWQWNGKF